ncbi:cytochrome P450 6a2-like [Camponotus floridanus]|uniref:cytochrome P450 6a2-like n=1 Tax=Camponotus floridanus TaxID=104421 RepID=UPI000DC68EF5|nr:cytochrome P450 6a2-like [Camponotus floridanus]
MGFFEILCIIATTFLAVYYYFTSNYDFWKSCGIRGPKPKPVFGNFKDIALNNKFIGDYLLEIYNKYKDESVIGIFTGMTPILIVKNPDLIKDVLIKDFSKFADRGNSPPVSEKVDPLSQHLAALEPKKWRPLRTCLSPVFTSSKLKEMFLLISKCADHLEQYIEKLVSKNEPIECREVAAKYTTDVIGTCAFGIEMNALSDENSEFRKIGKMLFMPTWKNNLRLNIRRYMPQLYKIFSYMIPQTEVTQFFTRLVMDTMNYRETNNIIRHDIIDALRELKKNPDKMGDIEMTDGLITSQVFVFFAAGFETSSSVISHALYELALNQQIQDMLREEIQEYVKHGNNLTYEKIKKMNYLDKVFKETLRKYPTGTHLSRKSMSSYTFNNTTFNIPKDQMIWIPMFAIHRDPDIYPKPDVFDPERFNDEAVQARHPMHYLPFGDGPRNCIGARFAIYQTKIGLVRIVQNYKVEVCDKTQIPYIIDPKAPVLAPKHGIHLRITKINRT